MGNLIEFLTDFTAGIEVSRQNWLEWVRLRRGDRARVHLVPRVLETSAGLVEAADLHFDDGSVTREVPYERFRFVD
jgi:hypothetical protein